MLVSSFGIVSSIFDSYAVRMAARIEAAHYVKE